MAGTGPLIGDSSRQPVLSNITPQVEIPGTAQGWAQLGEIGAQVDNLINDGFKERAARRGAEEGAAAADRQMKGEAVGRVGPRFALTDVDEARRSAAESAYKSRVLGEMDARLAEAKRAHALDPDTYRAEADKIVSGFVKGSASDFAHVIQDYGIKRMGGDHADIARRRQDQDDKEHVAAVNARQSQIKDDMLELARAGEMSSPRFAEMQAEWQQLDDERIANPMWVYSPEQAAVERDKFSEDIQSSAITGEALKVYGAEGRLATVRFIDTTISQLPGVPPERASRMRAQSMKALEEIDRVRKEEYREQREQERERRDAERAAYQDARLDAVMGSLSIGSVLGRQDLNDAQKASLVSTIRAIQRAGNGGGGGGSGKADRYDAKAADGSLTADDIDHGVRSGELSPDRGKRLAKLTKGDIKEATSRMTAPLREAYLGKTMPQTLRQQMLDDAADWISENPGATREQQRKWGEGYANFHRGQRQSAKPAPGQVTPTAGFAAEMQQISRDAAAKKISPAEASRRRAAVQKKYGR